MRPSRRTFLRRAGTAVVAAAAWPDWIGRAFADQTCESPIAEIAALSESYRRARRAGRPLLVIVVPEDAQEKWSRGQAFGELLNHGSDAQLAPLALAEVACARRSILSQLVPGAAGPAEPLMFVVETHTVPARLARLEAALAVTGTEVIGDSMAETEQRAARIERDIDRRIATLAGLLVRGLAADERMRDVRAAQVRATLSSAHALFVERAAAMGTAIPDRMLDRAAAMAWQAAGRSGQGAALDRRLAARVRARLVSQRIPGSRWARTEGCGTTIEGGQDDGLTVDIVACGMGHTPERSQRFLHFFSR